MESITLVLKKRKVKLFIYLFGIIFISFISYFVILNLIEGFKWPEAILLTILVAGILYICKNLFEFFVYGKVKLIVESDGKMLKFYCINANGKVFNQSSVVDLSTVHRFYINKKRTRYFLSNYDFTYEGKSQWPHNMDAFPSLYEAVPEDRNAVLHFIKKVRPTILLGFESFSEKMKKSRAASKKAN